MGSGSRLWRRGLDNARRPDRWSCRSRTIDRGEAADGAMVKDFWGPSDRPGPGKSIGLDTPTAPAAWTGWSARGRARWRTSSGRLPCTRLTARARLPRRGRYPGPTW